MASQEAQEKADAWGYGYVIGEQNASYENTYAFGQKTKVPCQIHYFCGGEADNWVFWTDELQRLDRTGWLSIVDYKWTPFIIGRDTEYPARVWQSLHPHTCTYDDWIPMPPQQLSVIQQVWAEVDAAYYKFNNDNTITAEQTTQLKGYMRGLCTAIRILMNPRFVDDDAVVAEVHKRHVMRTAEQPYQTPGVGEPLDADRLMKPVTSAYTKTYTAPPPAPPKHNLTDEQVTKIRGAREAGFPVADLAAMYKVSEGIIRAL